MTTRRRGLGDVGVLALGLVMVLVWLKPAPAVAQYFGRNKVQYESFDFRVLGTEHYDVHYYAVEEEAARDAARMAERWHDRLSRIFNHTLTSRKPIVLYADHPDFQQTNILSGNISEGTGGATESLKDRVVMPLTGSYADTDHVLGHELVHSFQYDVAKARGALSRSGIGSLPLWLIEGMAEYLSVGREDTHTAMWLRDAALRGDLPTLRQLTVDPRFFPYRYGQALWAYIGGRWGDRTITELYKTALVRGWPAALQRHLGMNEQQLSQAWMTEVRETYLPLMQGRDRPEDIARKVLASDLDAGEMNVSPAVSPDGRYVAFYSERDLFEVKLFLADAVTGEIVKELVSAASDMEVDALSFLKSAGTWSPDGRKFAYTVFSGGDNALAILDVETRKVDRRIELQDIGALQNPAWSPDGRSIVFSGLKGGISDLYLLDVETNRVVQLTDDKYANLQPAWSPDGTTIAFVTDQGPGTDFRQLTYGPMRLATMDVRTREVEPLDVFGRGKHIDPKYSPDGASLYFIADADGFSDVYRMELATGDVYQVTRLATGVSGVTGLSPALSVAQRDGRAMFSVFSEGNYAVYGMEAEEAQGTLVRPGEELAARPPATGILPPVEAVGRGVVATYLKDPTTGLTLAGDFEDTDYSPGLSLDYIGVPTVGVAVSSFGTGIAGSAAAFFSDMLGNRSLGVALQANGTVKDVGGQVFYQNMENQMNWGVGAGRIPYQFVIPAFYDTTLTTDGGTIDANVLELQRFRIYQDQVALFGQYPFSRSLRFEVGGGFTHFGFDLEADRFYLNDFGGEIGRDRVDLDDSNLERFGVTDTNVYLASMSAALVGDWSFFGFTSPIRGGRYRFEVSPTFGEYQYTTVIGDYRRYFFKYPFTLAFRGLHYGRYGANADDREFLLQPFYLTREYYIRGYAIESWDANLECVDATCSNFTALQGSRLAVANLEVRVPFIGVEQFGLVNFPFLPTELALFADAGVAWTGNQGPSLDWVVNPRSWDARERDTCIDPLDCNPDDATDHLFKRYPVFSAGISARTNLLGFLILEAYYAVPFQRPDRGAHFGFQVMPGW